MSQNKKPPPCFFGDMLESIKRFMPCDEFDALHGEGASDKWASPKVQNPYPEMPSEKWPTVRIKKTKE